MNIMRSARAKLQRIDASAVLNEDVGKFYPILVILVGLVSVLLATLRFGDQLKREPIYLILFVLYVVCDLILMRFLGEATISLGFSVIFLTLLVNYPDNSPFAALLIAALGSLISETLRSIVLSSRRLPWFTVARRAFFYASHHAVAGLAALVAYRFIHDHFTPWLVPDIVHIQATLTYTIVFSLVSMLIVWPHDRRIELFLTPDEEPFVRVDFLSTLLLLPVPVCIFYLYDLISGQTVGVLIPLGVLPIAFVLLFFQARSFTGLEEANEKRALREEIRERLGSPAHIPELTERVLMIAETLVDFRCGAVYSLVNGELRLRRYGIKSKRELVSFFDPTDAEKLATAGEDSGRDRNIVVWPLTVDPGEGTLGELARSDQQSRFIYNGLAPDTFSEPRLPPQTALIVFPITAESQEGNTEILPLIGLVALARPRKPFTARDWDRGQLLSSESLSAFLHVQDLEHRTLEIRRRVEGFASPPREMQDALQQLVARGVEVDEFFGSVSETELRENLQALLRSVVEEEVDAGSLITSDKVVEIYNQLLKKTAQPVMPPPEQVRELLETVTHSVPPAFILHYQSRDEAQRPKAFWKFTLAALEASTVPDILGQRPAVERTIRELRSSSLAGRDSIIKQLGQFLEILRALREAEDAVSETRLTILYSASQTLQLAMESIQRELEDPERSVLVRIANTWQTVVINAYYAARERGVRLAMALTSNRVLPLGEVTVQLKLENKGPGLASRGVVQILPNRDYEIENKAPIEVGPLPVGSIAKLDFKLRPNPGRDILTLKFLIIYHDPEGQMSRDEFVDRVYLREELMPFKDIKNVYTAGPPLDAGSALFFGREGVFSFIRHNLAAPSKIKPVLLLTGVRRMGKTSILKQLPQRLRDQPFIPVFLDCQRLLGVEATDFFWWLCNGVAEGLRAAGLSIDGLAVDLSEQPQISFENEFLPKVWERTGDRSLLLAIDEFEALHQLIQSRESGSGIFPYLRSLMQSEARMAFILVGSPRVLDLISSYESALFNLAQSKRVRFLGKDDALRLIIEPVALYGMVYDDLALDEILQLTACHPYFLQLVCACLVDYCNEKERNYVTIQDVRDVQERIIEQGSAVLRFLWAQSPRGEKAVLSALVSLLQTQEHVTAANIVEHLQERIGNLIETVDCDLLAVTEALERLTAREIIQGSEAPGAPCRYAFTAHLYHEWVLKYKSLDRILPELRIEVN